MSRNRSTRYLESDATPEENSHDYILEWDDHVHYDEITRKWVHDGPGSKVFYHNYEDAWEAYCDLRKNPDYIRVKELKQIN